MFRIRSVSFSTLSRKQGKAVCRSADILLKQMHDIFPLWSEHVISVVPHCSTAVLFYNRARNCDDIHAHITWHNNECVSWYLHAHMNMNLLANHVCMCNNRSHWMSQGSLANTLREIRPTAFMGVPRVWEKMQEKMKSIGAKSSTVRRKVASWAKDVGLQTNLNKMELYVYAHPNTHTKKAETYIHTWNFFFFLNISNLRWGKKSNRSGFRFLDPK